MIDITKTNTKIQLTLPLDMKNELEAIARSEGRELPNLIRLIFDRFLQGEHRV